MKERSLQQVFDASELLHADIQPLWVGLSPVSRRGMVVTGFCGVVHQHAVGQFLLVSSGLDVSAQTLIRPCYEALVRAIWTLDGASDKWLEGFLNPHSEANESDRETLMGPPVDSMLATIKQRHPAHVHASLCSLKDATWRAMHSYVHGGIRSVAQVMNPMPEHEMAGTLINANVMLMMATNVVRMASGLTTPELPILWGRHSDCLPSPNNC